MKLMLHACCGPCSLGPVRVFTEEGIEFGIEFSNPNIHPKAEYERRLQTIKEHVAQPNDIPFFEADYDPETWEEKVGIFGKDREKRCRACYRLRLERAAQRAAEEGYDALATSLTISPYQFTETILEELSLACAKHGLEPVLRDFRDLYPETVRVSRAKGMYRQNYCGCRYSIAEAELERAEHAAKREREKALKHQALLFAAAEGAVNQPSQL